MLQNEVKRGKLRVSALVLLLILEVIVTVALGTRLLALPYLQKSTGIESISLRDAVENPSNYLGERNVTLTLTRIELREDPYHRLAEQYYLAYVRDEEGYEKPFVISGKDEPSYKTAVGSKAVFELRGSLGPQLFQPPDRLITNILVSVPADPYSREYYRISIRLIGPIETWPSQPNLTLTYLTAAAIAAIALTLAIFWARRRRTKLDQPQSLAKSPSLQLRE